MKNNILLVITFLKTLFIFCQINDSSQLKALEIPVIFHISHTKRLSTEEKITFEKSLKRLVIDFNNRINFIDYDNLSTNFREIALKPELKLYLPNCDIEDKPIENIFWYKKSKITNNIHTPIVDDIFLRLKSKNKHHFLNIWIVDLFDLGIQSNLCNIDVTLKDYGGYTPSKFHIADGIVLDSDNIYEVFSDPFLLVHEFGHYLGLKHIWGDRIGCKYDDNLIDTPLQKEPHDWKNLIIQKSCDGGETNYQNFMDYSYHTGMFTEDQVEVMRNNLKTKRAGLLWKSNCSNISTSVLSKNKLRNKLGSPFNFNLKLSYNTNIDLTLKGFFESEFGILYNEQNLESLGLKIIGTDKFKVIESNEIVKQQDIYQRLDIEYVKEIVNANPNEFSRIKRVKWVRFYDVKNRKYYSQKEFPKQLKQHQVEAFEKESKNNLLLFNHSIGMDYNIYQNGKLITPQNLSSNKHINSFNLESGTYLIVCSSKSFYLGNGMKEIEYIKKLADITFEHLIDSEQTILVIKGDNKNRIFQKK